MLLRSPNHAETRATPLFGPVSNLRRLLPRLSLRCYWYCIIPASESEANRNMRLLRHRSTDGRRWRSLLTIVAVLSLTVSLATRFAVPAASPNHTVRSVTRCLVEPQRQRLNRDAAQWAAPVIVSAFAGPVILYSRVAPPEPQLAIHSFDDSPYNRPPPSLNFLL